MARYVKLATELNENIERFFRVFESKLNREESMLLNREMGHIVNLAVRCNPRQPQGTVRKNIVDISMGNRCKVSMTRETDPNTLRSYNKIHIEGN